jgi:hypothetical protein
MEATTAVKTASVEAAGVGETYTMVEATAHAMAEAVVAVVEAISTIIIGQIAVAVVGVVVSTAPARVGH